MSWVPRWGRGTRNGASHLQMLAGILSLSCCLRAFGLSTCCSAESQPELVEEFLGPIRLWALILSGERGREKAVWGQGSAGTLLPYMLLGRLLVEPSAPRKQGRVAPRGVPPWGAARPSVRAVGLPGGCLGAPGQGRRLPEVLRVQAGSSPRSSQHGETPAPGRIWRGREGEAHLGRRRIWGGRPLCPNAAR